MKALAMTPAEKSDRQTIAAVKNGDCDRYRELVERYERKVFGVAWARLGDPDLAEEATQETFIRAYCKLNFLHAEGRFGSWVTTIARHVSINLGLRRRHELVKRERWALHHATVEAESPGPDTPDPVSSQTLSQVLADLPAPPPRVSRPLLSRGQERGGSGFE
jgi:RNA polymerase sigma factor (sigma-70 family)